MLRRYLLEPCVAFFSAIQSSAQKTDEPGYILKNVRCRPNYPTTNMQDNIQPTLTLEKKLSPYLCCTSRIFAYKILVHSETLCAAEICTPDKRLVQAPSSFHKNQNHRAQLQTLAYSFGKF